MMLGIQGLFMQRWIIAFSVLALAFLIPCLPFSSYLLSRRCSRKWRVYKKNQTKAEQKRKRAAEKQAEKERYNDKIARVESAEFSSQ
jgi:hypothetical protein